MPVSPLRAVFVMKQSVSLFLIAKKFGGREEGGERLQEISHFSQRILLKELRIASANFVKYNDC